jgi:hypothetical protein
MNTIVFFVCFVTFVVLSFAKIGRRTAAPGYLAGIAGSR